MSKPHKIDHFGVITRLMFGSSEARRKARRVLSRNTPKHSRYSIFTYIRVIDLGSMYANMPYMECLGLLACSYDLQLPNSSDALAVTSVGPFRWPLASNSFLQELGVVRSASSSGFSRQEQKAKPNGFVQVLQKLGHLKSVPQTSPGTGDT